LEIPPPIRFAIWAAATGQFPQRAYAFDPSELASPTNFDPTQGGYLTQSYWTWRRDAYSTDRHPYAFDPNELVPPVPFDNTLRGLDWQRINSVLLARPDSASYWQRVLISDPSFYPAPVATSSKLSIDLDSGHLIYRLGT